MILACASTTTKVECDLVDTVGVKDDEVLVARSSELTYLARRMAKLNL